MGNQSIGIIDNWIRHIKDVYRLHNGYLDSIEDETERFNAFVEINAKEQVYDLSKTSIIAGSMEERTRFKYSRMGLRIKFRFCHRLKVNISSIKGARKRTKTPSQLLCHGRRSDQQHPN
jgi:carbonic anhydrase